MPAEIHTLFASRDHYVAHPHMAVLPDGAWVLVANLGPRRAVTLHPPHDPEFRNILFRSTDQGRTWTAPEPFPETGTECAGLTALPDGTLLLNQWRFRWYHDEPTPARDTPWADAAALRRERFGSTELELADSAGIDWARGGGVATIRRSQDGGRSFAEPITLDVAPYSGGYGMRGAVALQDGDILLPLSDAPRYRQVFALRSADGGLTWGPPEPIAAAPDRDYEEPAPLLLEDGAILMLLRDNVSHSLHAVRSDDRGANWSAPKPTGIDGYPAHLLRLHDGRIAAIVGCRQPPYRIAAYFSDDEGHNWDLPSVTIAALDHRDLGYPTAALRDDFSVFVAWYHRDAAGVTGLHHATATL